jgi:hypothetical protein
LLSLSWSMPPLLCDAPMSQWHSLWLWTCKQKIPPEHFTTMKTSLKLQYLKWSAWHILKLLFLLGLELIWLL